MDTEYLYILDYNLCAIHCIRLTKDDDFKDTDELLKHYGFNIDECACMYSSDELEIDNIN